MNETDDRESWASSVGDRRLATISVPAEDAAGEAQAAQAVRARGKFHPARWHVKDIRSARFIEHIRPPEEVCKSLAILAVADETKARLWPNFVCDASHVATLAAKREILGVQGH